MDEFLTIKETAALLRVSPITIRRYIASGELAAERVGRGIRVRREAIEDFVTPVAPTAKHLPLNSENAASTDGVLLEPTGESVESRAGTPTPSRMRTTTSGRKGKGQPSRRDKSNPLRNATRLFNAPCSVRGCKEKVGIYGRKGMCRVHYRASITGAKARRVESPGVEHPEDEDPVEIWAPDSPTGSVFVPNDEHLGWPLTEDDSLWKLVGIGDSGAPNDVASNKDKYLAEAILADKSME
jgi:excisionase family DNA binding protein